MPSAWPKAGLCFRKGMELATAPGGLLPDPAPKPGPPPELSVLGPFEVLLRYLFRAPSGRLRSQA